MRYIILFLTTAIIIGLPITGFAYAETGKNFDRKLLSSENGIATYQWTSHYNRISDGQKWVNYIWDDDGNIITFESANIIYKFNKITCGFELLNPVTKQSSIQNYEQKFLVNDLAVPPICNITDVLPNLDGLEIIVVRYNTDGEVKVTYKLNAIGFLEWTYEMTNTDLFKAKTFTIIEECLKCTPSKIEGDLISLNYYVLDTKNKIHDALKIIDNIKEDLTLTYESKPVGLFGKETIDPTFTGTTAYWGNIATVANTDTDCSGAVGTRTTGNDNNFSPAVLRNDLSNSCHRGFYQFDTTSINNYAKITDTDFSFDAQNCSTCTRTWEFIELTTKPQDASDATLQTEIKTGTQYTTLAANNGNNQSVDLGLSADTKLQSLLSSDWFAIGVEFTSMARDGVNHIIEFDTIGGTPNPTLTVTYTTPTFTITITNIASTIVGDKAKVIGLVTVTANIPESKANITSTKLLVNGTIITTNSTIQNSTGGTYSVNVGPFWYRMATGSLYNFTITSTGQNATLSQTNKTAILDSREYEPDYFTATIPSQGLVNYTLIDGEFDLNRNKTGSVTETFQVECFFQNWALVAFNSTAGDWVNQTAVGYYTTELNPNLNYRVACYNDDLLFDEVAYSNGPLSLLGISSMDQTYSSYIGVPVGVLFIVMAASLASQRNAPIWIVIILAIAGAMATIGFFTFDTGVWALALIAGLLGLFVGRKLF